MELGYDASDKTTRIDTVGHCPTQQGGTVLTLEYDGWGRRIGRTVGSLQTEYWYDATGLSREYEAATGTGQTGGRGETLFTRSPGGGLLSIKTGGATRNYGTDRSGSVTALTGTDGSLDATYRYDPWGGSNGATGTAYNPYRYTGTYFDSASDLYQMGARYYQAKSGRFTQTDPAGVETYGYGYGNPVNYTDRDGLTADPIETGGGSGPSPLSNVGPLGSGPTGTGARCIYPGCTAPATHTNYINQPPSQPVNYTGITNNPARRFSEHSGRFNDLEPIRGLSGTTCQWHAQCVEQALIERHGGTTRATNGQGPLQNRNNSISPLRDIYNEAVEVGNKLLDFVGLK